MRYIKWILFALGTILYLTNVLLFSSNTSHSLPHTSWDYIYCALSLLSVIIIGGSWYLIKKEN
jgi:hypothetical protein